MSHQDIEILKLLAKSWNNLDTSFIENHLTDDFIYKSQWVLNPILGKKSYLNFLSSKFTAIKATMQLQLMSITAEIALHPSLQNRPCIILTQITIEGINQVSVLINIRAGKIHRIEMCFIPDPTEAVSTGEFPK